MYCSSQVSIPAPCLARKRSLLWVSVGLLLLAATPAAGVTPAFKLFVEAPGPYRVSYEDLQTAGLEKAQPSARLALFNEGHPAPVWVEDGGDGVFGPGDWLEFLGEPPSGWVSALAENTCYNVYFVRFDTDDPLHMTAYHPGPVDDAETASTELRRELRVEEQLVAHDFAPAPDGRPQERWYWAWLTPQDGQPFAHNLDLSDLAGGSGAVELRIELRGASAPADGMADHRVEVMLGEAEIHAAEWDSNEPFVLHVPGLTADRFVAGNNVLKLRVSRRAIEDTVLLNAIEISYPRRPVIDGPWTAFHLRNPTGPMRLRHATEASFVFYSRAGSRMTSDAVEGRSRDGAVERVFYPVEGESSFVVASPDSLLAPAAIVRERPSRLAGSTLRADYIMIAHRRLLPEIQPLAALHRSRRLAVLVVDLQDIYDEFAGGLARQWAIRDFLAHAYHHWQKPAPRFVLLVGDAGQNARDIRISDDNFADHVNPDADSTQELGNRHLIPTWHRLTAFGRTANDNHFVAVAGQDRLPDMAIGRFPVAERAEVSAIVDKTIRYVRTPEVGPWRRDLALLVTGDRSQRLSRSLARLTTASGFRTRELHPAPDEASDAYLPRLIESLNEGQLMVHDLAKRSAPQQLEGLIPNQRLPVVLSLARLSAPFDQPDADSLGEKLLRTPGRGAIAVVATSGNGDSSGTWGPNLFLELTRPGTTIGEAVMRAKRTLLAPSFVESINLLGDPAAPVPLPAAEIVLDVSTPEGGPLKVDATLDASAFSGEVQVELLDADLGVLRQTAPEHHDVDFTVEIAASAEELAATRFIRAYAWDAGRGIDALGGVELIDGKARRPQPRQPVPARSPEDAPATAARGVAETLLADAVAWWSFDPGATTSDRLGKHSGTVVGRAGTAARPPAGGLAFYGRGLVDFGTDPQLDLGTADFTLHGWIRTRQARPQVWVILDKRTDIGYHLFNYQGRLGLQIANGNFTNYDGPFIADGDWHHFAVTVDRDQSDGIRWYIDGRDTGLRQDPTAHQASLDNPSPLTAAGRHHGGGHFTGDLDEMGLFRRALTADQVLEIYRAGW